MAAVKPQPQSPRRLFANNIVLDQEVASLLQKLEVLAKKHDPADGEASARGKDLAAFQALRHASRLMAIVAGWAIDHQIGLALKGLEYVPRGPETAKESPSLKAALADVDKHVHEFNGHEAAHAPEEQSPKVVQRLLFNIFRPQVSLPYTVYLPLVEGLEALQHGSRPHVFEPLVAGQKKSFEERKLILRAIGFVTFLQGVRGNKADAEATVLAAYGMKSDKIDSWMEQAKDWYSEWHVLREMEFAKNAVRCVKNHQNAPVMGEAGDQDGYERAMARFGEHAVAAAGRAYRQLTEQRRSRKRSGENGVKKRGRTYPSGSKQNIT